MVIDPAFQSLLSGDARKALWRVRKFQLEAVPEEEMGKLFSGDCYLAFSQTATRSKIFYWIGGQSSIDERTTVAIKAVELDDSLGGVPEQHRENQGYESQAFKDFFPEGFITLAGGYDSGLRHAEAHHEAKLFKVCGGKIPVLTEMKICWSSFNHGDTFVLDTGGLIFVWRGAESSAAEGLTGARLAAKLRNKIGEQIVHLEDGDEEDLTDKEREIWETYLRLQDKNQVQEAERGADRRHSSILQHAKLYRCREEKGVLTSELVKTGDLNRHDLLLGDSFVVNTGEVGVWVWLGACSTQMERRGAMEMGERVIREGNLPVATPLTKINMNAEPEQFKSIFTSWQE